MTVAIAIQSPILPQPVSNLTGFAISTTAVQLNWTAATDPGGPGIKQYAIYLNGRSPPIVYATSPGGATVSGLIPGTLYQVQVTAIDQLGRESVKSSVSVTTQNSHKRR